MSTVATLISRMKVSTKSRHLYCIVPYSKLNIKLLDQFVVTGYIYGYSFIKLGLHLSIKVKMKYYHNKPLINYIQLISKPGKRSYWTYKQLHTYLTSHKGSIIILSTNKGILNSDQALKLKIGGEALLVYY